MCIYIYKYIHIYIYIYIYELIHTCFAIYILYDLLPVGLQWCLLKINPPTHSFSDSACLLFRPQGPKCITAHVYGVSSIYGRV